MQQIVPQRESAEYDVVIIGAGPAGLSAAIRLKQMAKDDLSVCVLEKGSEVGAHILSGAVMDPIGLDALLPDWRQMNSPVKVPVSDDRYYILGHSGSLRIPHFAIPPVMKNKEAYIISLGNLCRWLASYAEELGVDIFTGMAVTEGLFDETDGSLRGVVAGVFGLEKDGSYGENTEPGMELMAKYTICAEGARGSLTKQLIKKYSLDAESDPPKFGLGMKELWEVDPAYHREGTVNHFMGWPLGTDAGGGGFMYHTGENQISLGFVVHLDYKNPYLNPYREFQRFKHHKLIADTLENGKRISYGARVITEGGPQSLPKMTFPGGILVGCAAGLVNVPRIKGSHNAILSGKLGAEVIFEAIQQEDFHKDLHQTYSPRFDSSPIKRDLQITQNVKPLWSRYSLFGALVLGGADMWCANLFGFNLFGKLPHTKSDAESTEYADKHHPIDYPTPDNKISFDLLTNLSYSFTNHGEEQPAHLHLSDPSVHIKHNLPLYDEPAQRYCPAGVYEIHTDENGDKGFVVNFQNCLHCKTCDIKDPSSNITWTPPHGGDGPNYPNM